MQAGCRQGREHRNHTSNNESKTTFVPLTRILISSCANVTEAFLHTIGVSESRDSLGVLFPAVSHDTYQFIMMVYQSIPGRQHHWPLTRAPSHQDVLCMYFLPYFIPIHYYAELIFLPIYVQFLSIHYGGLSIHSTSRAPQPFTSATTSLRCPMHAVWTFLPSNPLLYCVGIPDTLF